MDAVTLQEFGTRYTAAWCSQHAASVAAYFAESGSLTINDGPPAVGRTAITAAAQAFMTAFPDMVVTMDSVGFEGNRAIYRWTLAGTNTGPGGTGKAVRITGYEEWTIGADGLIAQSKGQFDEAEYERQLNAGYQAPGWRRNRETPGVVEMTMTNSSARIAPVRPSGITFLAVVNYVACGVTLGFWALVFFGRLVPTPGSLQSEAERASAAVTYGFMLGDVLYSVPLLLLAGSGLWRLRTWGWLAAQMANALWIYSMTVILMRDFYSRWSPGGLLFVPFAAIALWAVPYLWIQRRAFGVGS